MSRKIADPADAVPLLIYPGSDLMGPEEPWRLKMDRALIFHTLNGKLRLLTSHGISMKRSGGTPVIGPGTPLSASDEGRLLSMLLASRSPADQCGILPEHLLSLSSQNLMWWVPSQVRLMHLRDQNGAISIKTRWPTLVFLVTGRCLYLAALADDKRPSADTALFHAPLPNVYENSRLCTGDAKLPTNSDVASIEGWESVVFDTAFTHPNFNGGIQSNTKRKKGAQEVSVDGYWKDRNRKLTPFPAGMLVPMGRTLKDWLSDAEEE